jgi:hypothetical protein
MCVYGNLITLACQNCERNPFEKYLLNEVAAVIKSRLVKMTENVLITCASRNLLSGRFQAPDAVPARVGQVFIDSWPPSAPRRRGVGFV